ncbi:hypothetical protein QL285_042611 [Trifolium repens]|nr:hypothetical protein QL285_042611 [Trifolium repens]
MFYLIEQTLIPYDSYLDIPLTTGTEPRIIPEFFTPFVGVTLLTHVVLTTIDATSDSKYLHSYFFSSSRFLLHSHYSTSLVHFGS